VKWCDFCVCDAHNIQPIKSYPVAAAASRNRNSRASMAYAFIGRIWKDGLCSTFKSCAADDGRFTTSGNKAVADIEL